jgi:hypothetical protein
MQGRIPLIVSKLESGGIKENLENIEQIICLQGKGIALGCFISVPNSHGKGKSCGHHHESITSAINSVINRGDL